MVKNSTIMKALASTLESWFLPVEKLVCITTDNGNNIVAAIVWLAWVNCPVLATTYTSPSQTLSTMTLKTLKHLVFVVSW